MQAEAVVEAELRDGTSTVVRLRSDPPLSLRRTHGVAVVHLVGSGAGPIGGDDLVLRVRVGAGASLTLRSVAASIVLPGPTGAPSKHLLDAVVDDGGHLVVEPEPQILVRGCDHWMRTDIRLGAGATLEWRDETVLGRHDEAPGSLFHRVRIDRDGAALLRSDLAVGPRWPETLGAGGIDGAQALGTRVVVGQPQISNPWEKCGSSAQELPRVAGLRSAVMEIGPDAAVVSAVGGTARDVRRALHGAPLCTREGFVST